MDLLVLNTHEKDWKVGKEIRPSPPSPALVLDFEGLGEGEGECCFFLRLHGLQAGRARSRHHGESLLHELGLAGFQGPHERSGPL